MEYQNGEFLCYSKEINIDNLNFKEHINLVKCKTVLNVLLVNSADLLNSIHPNFEIKVKKTDDICKYVNQFAKIMKNKRLMKYGY